MGLNQLNFWGTFRVYPRILKGGQEKRKFHNAILIFFSPMSRRKALSRAPLPLLEWRKSLDWLAGSSIMGKTPYIASYRLVLFPCSSRMRPWAGGGFRPGREVAVFKGDHKFQEVNRNGKECLTSEGRSSAY
jgi:hypothetical protein